MAIFNQLGILGTPHTCLHAILAILQRNLDNGFKESPQIIEECYHVVYKLCSSTETCNATIRYLRNNHEFFTKHLFRMPFIKGLKANLIFFFMFICIVSSYLYLFSIDIHTRDELDTPDPYKVIMLLQQSWLLKCIALELRSTSLNRQRSDTHVSIERKINSILFDVLDCVIICF